MHQGEDDATIDLRRWLGEATPAPTHDDAVPGDAPRRRTWWRTALGLLLLTPWAALALLSLTDAHGSSLRRRTDDGPAVAGARAAPTGAASLPATRRTAAADPTASTGRDPSDHAVPAAVGPTAVRLVRDAVTRAGSRSTGLDVAAAEEVAEVVSADTWAVRVHAIVLHGDRHRWRGAAHEVWVAPVGVRDGRVVGLDRPWRVATIDGGPVPAAWRRAEVDRALVRGALDDAGIGHDGDLVTQRHPALPSIVRVTVGKHRRVWVRLGPPAEVVGQRTREGDR